MRAEIEGILQMFLCNLCVQADAIVEAKLKMSDINCALGLCSLIHQRYADFSGLLLESWQKVLLTKKDDKVVLSAMYNYVTLITCLFTALMPFVRRQEGHLECILCTVENFYVFLAYLLSETKSVNAPTILKS